MTEQLQQRINDRIENLREHAEKYFNLAQEKRNESDYDGQGDFDEAEKMARSHFSTVHKDLERIHELCKLSDEKTWGEHKLEEKELNGAP